MEQESYKQLLAHLELTDVQVAELVAARRLAKTDPYAHIYRANGRGQPCRIAEKVCNPCSMVMGPGLRSGVALPSAEPGDDRQPTRASKADEGSSACPFCASSVGKTCCRAGSCASNVSKQGEQYGPHAPELSCGITRTPPRRPKVDQLFQPGLPCSVGSTPRPAPAV